MKYLSLEIFSDFSCIGSSCPFTCCAGWAIIIDPDTDAYYKSVTGAFGDRLTANINRNNDKLVSFIRTRDGNCPFLNKENLCDIYICLGEEHLCYTCKTYPRYNFISGDIVFSGVSISCPEVARFYLSHLQPLQIDYTEDNTPTPCETDIDWNLFNYSVRVFTECISIAQTRSLTISERIASLFLFISEFQSQTDAQEDPSELIQYFSNTSAYAEILKDTCIYQIDLESKVNFGFELMNFFKKVDSFEKLLPEVSELYKYYKHECTSIELAKIQSATDALRNPEEQIWQEQLLAYVLYRYFMQGFSNRDFYNQFLTPLVLIFLFSTNVMMLTFIQKGTMPSFENKLMIIARISRIIEHSSNICDRAMNCLRKKGMLDLLALLKLIS